jgi:hypothetical protein
MDNIRHGVLLVMLVDFYWLDHHYFVTAPLLRVFL